MTTALRFEFIDNTLFILLLFAPVNLLLAGALALAAAGGTLMAAVAVMNA